MAVWVKVNISINYAPKNQELQNTCLSSLNCTICIHFTLLIGVSHVVSLASL